MAPRIYAVAVARLGRVFGALACVAGLMLTQHAARAVDIDCIEASRYKHLFTLFDNDPAKFAEYLQIPASRLPDPETCRAILVSGRIERLARGGPEGDNDVDRLLTAIIDNRGWVAAIYLSSPGGTVGTAMQLAILTRMFWLKTYAPGASFAYTPDFFGAPAADREAISADLPPDLAASWRRYAEATKAHARIDLPAGWRARCTSACTYPLVAGIDRHGTPYVHRGRRAAPPAADGAANERSLAETLDILQRSEARVIALYRHLDAGEKLIALYRATSTASVAPAPLARSPRYVADHLRRGCRVDVNAPMGANRIQAERCVAASHEKERLRQFAKLCGEDCDRAALRKLLRKRLRAATAAAGRAPN